MQIIHGARRSGKTTMLLEMAKRDGGIVLVRSFQEVRRLRDMSVDRVKTFDCVKQAELYGLHRDTPVYIDGLESFFHQIVHLPVRCVTLDQPGQVMHLSPPVGL